MKVQHNETAPPRARQVDEIIAECSVCSGSGVVPPKRWTGPHYACPERTCHECHGTGLVELRD